MADDLLPKNIEAEAALLGGLMIDNRQFDAVDDLLSAEHFYEPLHGRIYACISKFIAADEVANPISLKPYFEQDEQMQALGGVGYLAKLTGSSAALIGLKNMAQQIRQLAVLRELIVVGRRIADSAMDTSEGIDPAALVQEAEAALQHINGTDADSRLAFTAADCVAEVMHDWDTPLGGVGCGCIPEMDKALGLIRPTELVVMAGRPGSGKTAVALSYANGVARGALDSENLNGGGVLFVSMEMSALELGGRLIADTAAYSNPILYDRIANNWLNQNERNNIQRIHHSLSKLPMEVIQTSTLTTPRLRALVRRWKRTFEKRGVPMRLLVVDYLQLMSGNKKGRDENRSSEISEISRGLKQIAMEENIGVLALSQLSRAVEAREDKRPRMSDLRESGSIEQDANKVVGLFSELYYHDQTKPSSSASGFETKLLEWEADRENLKDKIEIIILKRRNGASGVTVHARFDREHQAVRGARN